MNLSKEQQGELFILSSAFLWSLFPVVTILSFASIPSIVSLAWSTLFSAIFFAAVLCFRRSWGELKKWGAYKDILPCTFFIGICYYLLFFVALQYTSAGNAGLIETTEILFTYLFFRFGRKDPLSYHHTAGAFLMLLGAGCVLYPNFQEFHRGDMLIVLACAIAPIGNFFQQRARRSVGSETIMFVRSIVSAAIIFLVVYLTGLSTSILDIRPSVLFLIVNGFLLLGLNKIFWIESIHRISVTKAIALSGISPFLTLFFAWLFLHNVPTVWQLMALVPMFFGVRFLQKQTA